MKKNLLWLFMAATLCMSAQEDFEQIKTPIANGSIITFNTLTPFLFNTPRYQFGYIHTINQRWKVGADLGYGNDGLTFEIGNVDSDNYRLFEVKAEVYYMLASKGKWNNYLSAEFFLINHQETFFDSNYTANDELTSVRYGSADYTRIKQGVNIKYGAFFNLSEKLGINFYYGLGVRVRDNKFENLTDFEILDFIEDEFIFGEEYRTRQGRRVGLNVTLGLKLYLEL